MYRHMRTYCKKKPITKDDDGHQDPDKKEILEMLSIMRNEIDTLREENNVLKQKVDISGVQNITNNTTNNIGNTVVNGDVNVVLVGYGKEDMDKINKQELLKSFRSGFHSTIKLIDTIHFNPDYPEYHNVYISSMKNKYAMMFNGNDWTIVMKDELIDKLYDDKRNYIEENMDEFLESLTRSQTNALHRWMDVDDDHHYIKKVKNDIKLMLYNKRKLPINNKYLIDVQDHSSLNKNMNSLPKVIKEEKMTTNELKLNTLPINSNTDSNTCNINRSSIDKSQFKRRVAPRNGKFRKAVARRSR